jgi:hypothetical protein
MFPLEYSTLPNGVVSFSGEGTAQFNNSQSTNNSFNFGNSIDIGVSYSTDSQHFNDSTIPLSTSQQVNGSFDSTIPLSTSQQVNTSFVSPIPAYVKYVESSPVASRENVSTSSASANTNYSGIASSFYNFPVRD